MYEIRHAGAKGLGVFATKNIPRGTRILSERPILGIKSERDVFAAARNLSLKDYEGIRSLSVSPDKPSQFFSSIETWMHALLGSGASTRFIAPKDDPQEPKRPFSQSINEYPGLLSAFRNNNFDIGENTQAIFKDICRINHSCVPSAQGNFNTALGEFTIQSTRAIDQEEEITISYAAERGASRYVRVASLQNTHGFQCDCPICDGSSQRGKDSEQRRKTINEKLKAYAEKAGEAETVDSKSEYELTCEMIEMYEAEGLAGRELATMYLSAAELACGLGLRDFVTKFTAAGLQIEEDCLGTDNPMLHESKRRANIIRQKR